MEQKENNISSIYSMLTQLIRIRIEESIDEREAMSDSPSTLEELKAEILRKAEEAVKELDIAAAIFAKHGLPLPGVEAPKEPALKPDQEAASQPLTQSENSKMSSSAYIRHEKPWTDTIVDILKKSSFGLTHGELKDELANTHLGERLRETETGFYGAVAKLKARKMVALYRGKLFTPKTLTRFKKDVELGIVDDLDVVPAHGRSSAAKDAIVAFLSRKDFANSNQIFVMLRNHGKTVKQATRSPGTIYNLLSKMTKRGELSKDRDGRYSLVKKTNEASTGEPGDASVNGRDDALPIESHEDGVRRTLHS